MVKRCVRPYMVGVCIAAVLSVSYVGIRAYQRHLGIKPADSAFHEHNHTEVDNHHVHSFDNHTQRRKNQSLEVAEHHEHIHTALESEHVHEFNGEGNSSGMTISQKLELDKWIETGKLTPFVEQELNRREEFRRNHNVGRLLQKVLTPDGQLGQVVVNKHNMHKEGDVISRSDLVAPESHPDLFPTQPRREKALILPQAFGTEGVHHKVPDEYYAIADLYEREEYFNKFEQSIVLGISMDEVEAKIAAGELDVSLSDSDKQQVDERLARYEAVSERIRLIDMGWPKPTPLDQPPVKVRFNREFETVDGLSGLKHQEYETISDDFSSVRDVDSKLPKSIGQVGRYEDHSVPRRSKEAEDVPPLPDNVTPESIKAQLNKFKDQLSPERFSKAQRLLDEFGTDEGLRQLREMPPEHRDGRNSQEKP